VINCDDDRNTTWAQLANLARKVDAEVYRAAREEPAKVVASKLGLEVDTVVCVLANFRNDMRTERDWA
jgi:signal recognition particle GTPase